MQREPRTVLILLSVAVAGHAIKLIATQSDTPPGQVFAVAGRSEDPRVQRDRAVRLARPLGQHETIDLNTASAEEIARLPRVGMSLAKRITGTRDSLGRFGQLQDLDRVPGIGPVLLGVLASRVTFSGLPVSGFPPGRPANPGTSGAYGSVPGVANPARVDLNSASQADLIALPGIGRARALAVLAYRRSHGSFALVSDLEGVPGFSRSLVEKLKPFLWVR